MRAWVAGGVGFVWTPARLVALELVWADELTDAEIAREVGVCRRTLGAWKATPAFQAEIKRKADACFSAETRRMRRRILRDMW